VISDPNELNSPFFSRNSLQHHFSYVQKVPEAINELYNLPSSWECTAIMPFGVRHGEPGQPGHPKTFQSLDERVKVIRN
jgi:hypothetical protein